MNRTGIEYLDYTWNPTHGCSPVSAGCENCWACTMATRLAGCGARGYDKAKPFAVTFHPGRLDEPLQVKKPALIGVSFMGDLFHKAVTDAQIRQVLDVMELARQHTFVLLTKRPERMMWFSGNSGLPPNVWPGTSVENQAAADDRLWWLLQIKAAVRIVSCEPLLEEVTLAKHLAGKPGLQWVIAGCESGPGRKPCQWAWAERLRVECVAAGVPFYLKQMAENEDGSGKVIHAPILDGRRWLQHPEEAA